MKTKRWMTGWIAILLLCTFLLPAQAVEAGGKPQESTETVTYQNADYRGLSAIETAEKKAGVPCAFKRDDSAALCG